MLANLYGGGVATLTNTQTKESVLLLVQHTFGRHPGESSTVLNNPEASRMHAVITWDGDHWFLRDSSTNGTAVNGARVASGSKMRLSKGDTINFGGANSTVWILSDVSPPQNMLLAITPGLADIAIQDIVALPSENSPEVTIYASGGYWVCESEAGISVLNSGDRVGTQNCVWCFIEAKVGAATQAVHGNYPINKPLSILPTFNVSQNEEHVLLKIQVDGQEIDLGQRNHHYLLLLLARKRIEDREAGISDSEQGWIDKGLLGKMAGLKENHINIYIYRFRKQLTGAMPLHLELPSIVEKRRGEIRFSCSTVEINGGAHFDVTAKTSQYYNQVELIHGAV